MCLDPFLTTFRDVSRPRCEEVKALTGLQWICWRKRVVYAIEMEIRRFNLCPSLLVVVDSLFTPSRRSLFGVEILAASQLTCGMSLTTDKT